MNLFLLLVWLGGALCAVDRPRIPDEGRFWRFMGTILWPMLLGEALYRWSQAVIEKD